MDAISNGNGSDLILSLGHVTLRRPGFAVTLGDEGSPRFFSIREPSLGAKGFSAEIEDRKVKLVHRMETDGAALKVRFSIENSGRQDICVKTLSPLWCGEPLGGTLEWNESNQSVQPLRMSCQPEWMGGGGVAPITGSSRELDYWSCESHWWASIARAANFPALFAGVGSWANATIRIRSRNKGGNLSLAMLADLVVDRDGSPLRIPGGERFELQELLLVAGDTVNSCREEYMGRLSDSLGDTRPRNSEFRRASGVFSGYSMASRPDHPQSDANEEFFNGILAWADRNRLVEYGFSLFKTQFSRYSTGPAGKVPPMRERPWPSGESGVTGFADRILSLGFVPEYDLRKRLPHGVRALTNRLKERGYTPAFDSRPFLNYAGGVAEHDAEAAETYRRVVEEWGYRYLMFDFVSTDYESQNDRITMAEGIRSRFEAIREAVGEDVYIEACMCPIAPVLGVTDGYRPAEDWRPGAHGAIAREVACRLGPDRQLVDYDLEYLDPSVRPACWDAWSNRGWQSLDTLKSATTLFGTLGYRALIGGFLEEITPERLKTFLSIMPPDGVAATPVDYPENDPPRVWWKSRSLSVGRREYLGLFNHDSASSVSLRVPLDLVLSDRQSERPLFIFSFWEQTARKVETGEKEALTFTLEPGEARGLLLTVVDDPSSPEYLGSTLHLTGDPDLEELDWDAADLVLSGRFRSTPHRPVDLYFSRPDRLVPRFDDAVGCSVEIVDAETFRVTPRVVDGDSTRFAVPFGAGAYII